MNIKEINGEMNENQLGCKAEFNPTPTPPQINFSQVMRLQKRIQNVTYTVLGSKTTVCLLTTVEGFEVVGTSACVNPADFKKDLGERLAYKDALDKLDEFEGYKRQIDKMPVVSPTNKGCYVLYNHEEEQTLLEANNRLAKRIKELEEESQSLKREHELRVKYQDKVYKICQLLDWMNSKKLGKGCTIDEVCEEVKLLTENYMKLKSELEQLMNHAGIIKTDNILADAVVYAQTHANANIYLFYYPAIPLFMDEFEAMFRGPLHKNHARQMIELINGSRVYFRTIMDDRDASKYDGREMDYIGLARSVTLSAHAIDKLKSCSRNEHARFVQEI